MKKVKSNFSGLEFAEVLSRKELKKVIAGTGNPLDLCGIQCGSNSVCSKDATCKWCWKPYPDQPYSQCMSTIKAD